MDSAGEGTWDFPSLCLRVMGAMGCLAHTCDVNHQNV